MIYRLKLPNSNEIALAKCLQHGFNMASNASCEISSGYMKPFPRGNQGRSQSSG